VTARQSAAHAAFAGYELSGSFALSCSAALSDSVSNCCSARLLVGSRARSSFSQNLSPAIAAKSRSGRIGLQAFAKQSPRRGERRGRARIRRRYYAAKCCTRNIDSSILKLTGRRTFERNQSPGIQNSVDVRHASIACFNFTVHIASYKYILDKLLQSRWHYCSVRACFTYNTLFQWYWVVARKINSCNAATGDLHGGDSSSSATVGIIVFAARM